MCPTNHWSESCLVGFENGERSVWINGLIDDVCCFLSSLSLINVAWSSSRKMWLFAGKKKASAIPILSPLTSESRYRMNQPITLLQCNSICVAPSSTFDPVVILLAGTINELMRCRNCHSKTRQPVPVSQTDVHQLWWVRQWRTTQI